MLLNTLQCTGQHPEQRIFQPQVSIMLRLSNLNIGLFLERKFIFKYLNKTSFWTKYFAENYQSKGMLGSQ